MCVYIYVNTGRFLRCAHYIVNYLRGTNNSTMGRNRREAHGNDGGEREEIKKNNCIVTQSSIHNK